jgi:glycosyltransferase involved in cell wall biosynthesis
LKRLGVYLDRVFHHRPKISLLIPFSSKDPVRRASLHWLVRYWQHELPDAEIVIGESSGEIFSKGEALNDAVRQSSGEILVILDADAYISGKVIDRCADRIIQAARHGHNMWFVPYRRLYRLTKEITKVILESNPRNPLRLPEPPPPAYYDNHGDRKHYGHRYGAMITILPRRAYHEIGCFDERFRGWGGEDVALLRALDTLFGKHKTTNNDVYHLWHPNIGADTTVRMWEGQDAPNVNGNLTYKYHLATRNPSKMKALVDGAIAFKNSK